MPVHTMCLIFAVHNSDTIPYYPHSLPPDKYKLKGTCSRIAVSEAATKGGE